MKYWIRQQGREIGPFGKGQVPILLQSSLEVDAEVLQDGSSEWQPAAAMLRGWGEASETDTEFSAIALSVATEVVKQTGWTHQPMDDAVLALRNGGHLLVIVASSGLTVTQAEAAMERWYTSLSAGEWKGVTVLDLLYCLTASDPALQSLRKKRKVGFLGRHTVRFDYVDPSPPPARLGSLDSEVSAAVGAGVRRFLAHDAASGPDFLAQLTISDSAHGELDARLKSVKPWGTFVTLGICLTMFTWASLVASTENVFTLLRFGANFSPLTIDEGQWWRLYSCTFLHIGIIHLACNMLTLLSVGARAEQVYGNARYLALYAIAGLTGSLASVFTSDTVSAGASGALFGVCGAIAVLGWRYREQWPPAFRRSLFQGMLPMIGYNLAYGFSNSGIDNAAHLGGLLAGAVFALLVRPQALDQAPPARPLQAVLLTVGLMPFVVQGWAVHSAIVRTSLASYPQRTFTDPSGDLEVKMPALFKPKTVGSETFFQGPGMAFSLQKLEDPNVVVIDSPAFMDDIRQVEGTSSAITKNLAGRTWALRDGKVGEARIRQGFAYIGTILVKVEVAVAANDSKEGALMRMMLIESMQRKDYDQLNQGKALAKMGLHARALEELAGVEETLEVAVLKVDSLIALSRYDEADKLLARLEEKHPDEKSVLESRWSLCEEKKDYKAALIASQRFMAKVKDPQEKFHRLVDQAELLEELGRGVEARPLYAQARAGYQNKAHIEADILNGQAWSLVLKKRYKEALPLTERALKAEENSANLDTRGRALLELGQLEKAKADYEKILNEDINEPYANYAWGRILEKEGDAEKARLFYCRYVMLAGLEGEFSKDAIERVKKIVGARSSKP